MPKKKTKKYKFDKVNHYHSLDDKPLYGVTTVLRVVNKPSLVNWSSNMAVKHLKENSKRVRKGVYEVEKEVFDNAKKAHRMKKKAGGDRGSSVHDAVEKYIKKGIMFKTDDEVEQKMFDNFVLWATENEVHFVESEKNVHSEEHWVGGICDFVFEMGGQRYIGDLKTGSGVYPEHYLQMGAYDICLQEMGYPPVNGYIVVHTPATGKLDQKVMQDMVAYREGFLSALSLFKVLEKMKWNPYF